MSVIPWNHFHFIGYTIAISLTCSVALLDTAIFFCTMANLIPIYVRSWRKKNLCYSVFMFTFGVILIIFGALALTEKFTEEEIRNLFKSKWSDLSHVNETEEAIKFWNAVQIQYKCCGIHSVSNYNLTEIPKSCCATDVQNCTVKSAHQIGCLNAVLWYFTHVLQTILVTMAFLVSCLCFLLILMAYICFRRCGLSTRI